MIVGQMALCRFPLWEMCLSSLADKVDALYVRFDKCRGNPDILNRLESVCQGKLKDVLESSSKWNAWNWREEMLRMLDSVKPELVLTHDEDEVVEDGVFRDVQRFRMSKHKQLALEYAHPMPTADGYYMGPKTFPSKPHVMVIKWQPKLKYHPYMSRNRVTQYGKEYMLGKSKILHYCYYTKELRALKAETQSHKDKVKWVKTFGSMQAHTKA